MFGTAHEGDGLVDLVPSTVIEEYLKSGKPLDDMPVVMPNLAESWEISKDGLDYTFHLMKGVTFHNGKDFKAEDVDFCLKRVLSKPVASSSATKQPYRRMSPSAFRALPQASSCSR